MVQRYTLAFPHPLYLYSSVQVKMNRMRLRIAQRLKEAQNTCAMLTTFNEVDMRWAPGSPKAINATFYTVYSLVETLIHYGCKSQHRRSWVPDLSPYSRIQRDQYQTKDFVDLWYVKVFPCKKTYIWPQFCFSNIQEMRKNHRDAFLKKHNIKLGFMSAFVKAAAHALTDQPVVNAGKTASTAWLHSIIFHCFCI